MMRDSEVMCKVLNFFFARSHSLAYAIVLSIQAVTTALTGMFLIPLIAAVFSFVIVYLLEEANIEVQKQVK